MIPQTRHIRAFIFVQNTEHRHAREKGWKNVRYVPATGLYDRETARALAEHAVKTEKSSLHTLALVRIVGGCASLSDKKETEQQKRHLIVMAFSLLLGSDCVIGELGEDKITIFRPDAVSRIRTRQKIDEAFAFVRYALSDTIMADSLRFVAAVICENLHDLDYEGLLSEAESICRHMEKRSGGFRGFLQQKNRQKSEKISPQRFGYIPGEKSGALSAEQTRGHCA